VPILMRFLSFLKRSPDAARAARRVQPAQDPASVDELRVRTRRRLIGAAVLVVAAVVTLPLIFEGPPRPVSPRVAIELPPRGTGASAAIEVAAPSTPGGVASERSALAGVPLVSGPLAASSPPLAAAPVERSLAGSVPTAASGVVAGRSAAERFQVPARPASAVVRKPAAPVRANTAAVADPAARPVVRGSASDEPKPKPAVVAKEAGRTIKPEKADRADQADRAEKAMQADKSDKSVRPAARSAPAESRVWVQVGAYADPSTVKNVRQKVDKLGLRSQEQVVQTPSGQRTRVRLGPYASREEADRAVARLRDGGFSATVVAP
jgi:DedD protein